jgi:hypothetical protein
MTSSTSARELFDSEPARAHPLRGRRRLAVIGVAVVSAVVAVLLGGGFQRSPSPAVAYVETWIDAWNARDAQTVSSMTCGYPPAFVAAGTIEMYMGWAPAARPVLAHHTVTGTRTTIVDGRSGVRVDLAYVPGGQRATKETSVFVRTRGGGDMCIGYFSVW